MEAITTEGVGILYQMGVVGVVLGYYMVKDFMRGKTSDETLKKINSTMAVQNIIIENLTKAVDRLEARIGKGDA